MPNPNEAPVTASVDMHRLVSRLCDALTAEPNLIVDYRDLFALATIPGSTPSPESRPMTPDQKTAIGAAMFAPETQPVEGLAYWRERCECAEKELRELQDTDAVDRQFISDLFGLGPVELPLHQRLERAIPPEVRERLRAALAKATTLPGSKPQPVEEGWRSRCVVAPEQGYGGAMCWTVRHGQTTLFERADGSVVWDHGARTLFPTEAEARDALAKAPPPPDIEPKDGSAKVGSPLDVSGLLEEARKAINRIGARGPVSDEQIIEAGVRFICGAESDSPAQPAPTPKAEPKPIPWPIDLSTLVGKIITVRVRENGYVGTLRVRGTRGTRDLDVTEINGQEFTASTLVRDLLSIEDAEPATFAPLPEGWVPEGVYAFDSSAGVLHRNSRWLAELNRLRRELHELRDADNKTRQALADALGLGRVVQR